MFENRSFDHLLGRLYEWREGGSFEGVIGKDLSNPIPAWAEHGADRGVPYGVAMLVLSTLARGFAVFDHWFADVPSQTFTNRSFFHAGSASGLVINALCRTWTRR